MNNIAINIAPRSEYQVKIPKMNQKKKKKKLKRRLWLRVLWHGIYSFISILLCVFFSVSAAQHHLHKENVWISHPTKYGNLTYAWILCHIGYLVDLILSLGSACFVDSFTSEYNDIFAIINFISEYLYRYRQCLWEKSNAIAKRHMFEVRYGVYTVRIKGKS